MAALMDTRHVEMKQEGVGHGVLDPLEGMFPAAIHALGR